MPKRSRTFWLKPKVGDLVWSDEIANRNFGTVVKPASATNEVVVKFFPFEAFSLSMAPEKGWFNRAPEYVHRKFLRRAIATFVGPVQL